MIEKLILTRDEICDLVASILTYNRKKATEFRFAFLDGSTITPDFVCEVACDAEPIKVRIVPENEDILPPAMESAARMIDQWRKQRGQPTIVQAG